MSLTVTVQEPASDNADKAAKKTSVELPAEIFDVEANIALIHQVVVAQLAAARQGTASTKTRGEVRGGGKKPYRQKGTGRARQGSTRAPQFTGGGIVHGPKPRTYEQRTPTKMKVGALRGALSDRARNDRVHVVSTLVSGDVPSTKTASAALAKITESRHVLVVAERTDELTWKSLRNLGHIHMLEPGQLNTYDVLISDDVVFTRGALEAFLGGPLTGKSVKSAATSGEVDAAEVEEAQVVPDDQPAKPAKKAAKATAKAAADTAAVETDSAEAAEPVAAAEATDAAEAAEDAPYGPDSHAALDDGAEPDGFPIKGNASSKLYHVPGSAFYDRTVAEVWFRNEEAAQAAGFELPPSQRAKKEEDS